MVALLDGALFYVQNADGKVVTVFAVEIKGKGDGALFLIGSEDTTFSVLPASLFRPISAFSHTLSE